ncbi:Competence/damage inducible protein CinA [Pseudomonas syringae pv. helianthi]|uniref:Competence/damage inducible protein CinA n=2 Tax=Pseudomonas syringae group genomosp. 7 TaxID=251699 RepID=A0A0P9TUW8_9PSED|nr:Competence/damage inducible protein CinA [Pseudomonas syringae pv. helianthi]KPY82293.1 Competence/damage inducible protein CinA [Pseudomonas syringae pv. tagetis]RMR04453.1 Competence/damage inducible protein CinA [Pseudomonas syringae pv. helianthi]RMW16298.1 Competence/damage inducible protein CinA [Pseudomonas syringae pv. tagetis]RMW27624.1 Competence/damage inducible protein CinA [Pseudomonas syringae pv. tagetis]
MCRIDFHRCHPIVGRHCIKKDLYMKNKRARDSVNGRFIPLEEARKRPRETTVETVKKPARRKND